MLFILLVITLFNILNGVYALGIQYSWFGEKVTEMHLGFSGLGDVATTVISTLVAVILAAVILLKYKQMSEYDQQFEKISMISAIVCSLINVFIVVVLMIAL